MRCLALFILLVPVVLGAQNIPTGQWRSHLSYRSVSDIAESGDRLYCLTTGGLFYVNRTDNSIEKLSSVTGLRRAAITAIENIDQSRLIVGYNGGEIDVISESEIQKLNDITESGFSPDERYINHIFYSGQGIYVSTRFGVVEYNPTTLKVKNTFWQLDADGSSLEVYAASVLGTEIVIATEKGLMSGSLDDNLLDFNNWTRYFSDGIANEVIAWQGSFYAAMQAGGLYEFVAGNWILTDFNGIPVSGLNPALDYLWINLPTGLEKWTSISSEAVAFSEGEPVLGFTGSDEWIGSENGLYQITGTSYTPYIPSGPFSPDAWSVHFHNKTISVLSGGYNTLFGPTGNTSGIYLFSEGTWSNYNDQITTGLIDFRDPVDITYSSSMDKWIIACYDQGIFTFDGSMFDQLEIPFTLGNRVPVLISDNDGLWVVDAQNSPAVYHLDLQGNWNSFILSGTPPVLAKKIVSDRDYLYILLDPTLSGEILMVDKSTGSSRRLDMDTDTGDFPGVPTALTIDANGRVWVGTTNGVAYFFAGGINDPINSITPISEFSPLLIGQKVNDIEVDGANRKWISTDDGVLLMNERGEEVVLQFSVSNSPLLSDVVTDIEVNDETGEVFFITDTGLISYRSDATTPSSSLSSVKIFPNPVRPGFDGFVTITGLVIDTEVKITDVSGQLVWESISNGGSVSWNQLNLRGEKSSTGMYYIYLSDENGIETFVGKIAIIR